MLLNQLELTKKNIASSQQVSAEELDDLMRTDQDGLLVQNYKAAAGSPNRGSQVYSHISSDQQIQLQQ